MMVGTITILSSEWKFILIPIALVVSILTRRGDWRRIYPWVERGDIMALPRNTINPPGLEHALTSVGDWSRTKLRFSSL